MPLEQDVSELTSKIKNTFNSKLGNPIACATELSNIEKDIALGRTYWHISEEQHNRFLRGGDACLSCESSYTEAKNALTEIGNRYTGLPEPEKWIRIEDIAAQVREQTARELFKAEAHARELQANCGIKLVRVRSRITKMKPLAHVGRWDEFMEHQRQLLSDFELDIKEIIPEIEVRIPSYAVPRPKVTSEYEEIKAKLTEEERKKLEEREVEQAKVKTIPKKWAAYKCPYCDDRFETIIKMHEHVIRKHPEKMS